MYVEHITFLYEETAEHAAARLALSTVSTYDEDLKTAAYRCGDDLHVNLRLESRHHGAVTFTGMRLEMREDGSSGIVMRFEVELNALSDAYRPKNVYIMDHVGGVTGVLSLKITGMFRSNGPPRRA